MLIIFLDRKIDINLLKMNNNVVFKLLININNEIFIFNIKKYSLRNFI